MAHTHTYDETTVIGVNEWERAASRPLVPNSQLENTHPFDLTRTQIEQQLSELSDSALHYKNHTLSNAIELKASHLT